MNELSVKDKEQRKAFRSYAYNGCVGSIIAGTGFGKTRVGVFAIVEALNKSKLDALVLVPFEHLKDNFKEEMRKTGHEKYIDRVQFYCYASVKKLLLQKFQKYCVLVCDEIHLGLTDICFKLYNTNMFDRKMFLTATLPDNYLYRTRLYKIGPVVYTLTIDECVKKGLVAPYTIKCVSLSLTPEEKKKYKMVSKNYEYWRDKLGKKDAFSYAKMILAHAKEFEDPEIKAAIGFYRAIRQRKRIVDHAENKIKIAKLFSDSIKDRMLVFGGDNTFTDSVAAAISGSAVYHSKKSKKVKEAALKDFNSGEVNVLCSTKALNQGLDIPDVAVGLICGLTSKALTMIQRVGRLLRIDPNNPNKKGSVIVLYVKGSQEENWLRKSLKSINSNKILWINAKELQEELVE